MKRRAFMRQVALGGAVALGTNVLAPAGYPLAGGRSTTRAAVSALAPPAPTPAASAPAEPDWVGLCEQFVTEVTQKVARSTLTTIPPPPGALVYWHYPFLGYTANEGHQWIESGVS